MKFSYSWDYKSSFRRVRAFSKGKTWYHELLTFCFFFKVIRMSLHIKELEVDRAINCGREEISFFIVTRLFFISIDQSWRWHFACLMCVPSEWCMGINNHLLIIFNNFEIRFIIIWSTHMPEINFAWHLARKALILTLIRLGMLSIYDC